MAVGAGQVLGFRGGSRNYSIFQRRDGLLFLYSEIDEAQAARDQVPQPHASTDHPSTDQLEASLLLEHKAQTPP